MKILVANLGSTSFKYRLFDMDGERQLARGSIERIGESESPCTVQIGDQCFEKTVAAPDHGVAVRECLAQLTDPVDGCISDASEVSAIGFKAVHGGRYSGVQRVTDEVFEVMTDMSGLAPAHNPPYIRAMRQLRERLPELPLVAAFETGFHQTIPDRNRYYAVPHEWAESFGILRWGFHGASHRYIATRTAELVGRTDLRIISCHLGGSSSLCAIRNGESVATSMGSSPQTGLPQNNRVGDFDPFAIPVVMERTGMTLDEVLKALSSQSGLLGLSGVGTDLRDIAAAATNGNERAQLALDVYVGETRRYIGGYLVELGGADCIVFTGGIGENRAPFRKAVCSGLEELGIMLDDDLNNGVQGGEAKINHKSSRTEIWVVPTNEELIVARQTQELLQRE
jgi:acetate kinase